MEKSIFGIVDSGKSVITRPKLNGEHIYVLVVMFLPFPRTVSRGAEHEV